MEKSKKCPECGEDFVIDHGNDTYCPNDCYYQAKGKRQHKQWNAIRRFRPIIIRNNEVIEQLDKAAISEISASDLEARGVDLSLCRYLKPPPENMDSLLLDFGQFTLITDRSFQTFKIQKNETSNPIQGK